MRSLRQQIEEKCIHFNGVQNDTCKAGIKYTELKGRGFPCFRGGMAYKLKTTETQIGCDKLEWPSEEYIQNELKEHDDAFAKVEAGLNAVKHIREEYKGRHFRGVIECPVCKGKLHVRHAACNAHVHAHCETPDCIAWME